MRICSVAYELQLRQIALKLMVSAFRQSQDASLQLFAKASRFSHKAVQALISHQSYKSRVHLPPADNRGLDSVTRLDCAVQFMASNPHAVQMAVNPVRFWDSDVTHDRFLVLALSGGRDSSALLLKSECERLSLRCHRIARKQSGYCFKRHPRVPIVCKLFSVLQA